MKSVKTKLATALFLAGLMVGFFSFSTTRIAAQETSSNAVATTQVPDKSNFYLAAVLARAAAERMATLIAGQIGANTAASEYPVDSLD